MSALEDFGTLADKYYWTLYRCLPMKTMGMTGEDIEIQQMTLLSPEGQKVSFWGRTVDEVIAEATRMITTRKTAEEES